MIFYQKNPPRIRGGVRRRDNKKSFSGALCRSTSGNVTTMLGRRRARFFGKRRRGWNGGALPADDLSLLAVEEGSNGGALPADDLSPVKRGFFNKARR